MFTGIIESLGAVSRVFKTTSGLGLEIKCLKPIGSLKQGESIAVNGVCLTAAKIDRGGFTADVVDETLKATTLTNFKKGDRVHLERALKLGARMGGHFLTGHVDGRGKVLRVEVSGRSKIVWLQVPKKVQKYVVTKGSIAVDGVSLTVQSAGPRSAKIALIPHTLHETILGALQVNDEVNIETDAMLRQPELGAIKSMPRAETARLIKKRVAHLTKFGF